ncbi:hypothetical protein [Nitrosococcus wardiae]|uniref:hypothetical protein n=1 Tax=Nitrosococcus wardiae TaxID=1814290 RepID=UPI001F0D61DF|nr:hypothetical protein [Nitrosococcus wardiae]
MTQRKIWITALGLLIASGVTLAQEEKTTINFGHNGTWFNPNTSGQGFFIDVIPSRQEIVASWFTFNISGTGQRWFTAQGTFEDNRAELTLLETTGGVLNDPTPVATTEVGTLTFEFQNCTNGTASFNIPGEGLAGAMSIIKLVPDVVCNNFANGSLIVRD